MILKGITRKIEHKTLGDEVAKRAQPVARAIKRATGVDLTKCGGCTATHRALNGGGSLPGERAPTVI